MVGNKNVLITGGTGFIGKHLVPLFLNKDYKVTLLCRDEKKIKKFEWHKDVNFKKLDLNKKKINFIPKKNSGLVHLAWQNLPNYEAFFHLERNLISNFNFLKHLIDKGIEQVLVSGTCFEYGIRNGAISSNCQTNPITPYALSKDTLRKMLLLKKQETPFRLKWARLFYMYGDFQNTKSFLPQLELAIKKKEKVFKMSKGDQMRDYLPVETVAKRIFKLYQSKKNGTFNISSGKPISLKQLAEKKIKEFNSEIKLELGYYPYSNKEPKSFWGVPDKF